jgi:hypothetical protein
MMVVLGGRRNTNDDDEELEVDNTSMERRKKWKGMMLKNVSGFSFVHSWCRAISNFLDQGCRYDIDAKIFRFLYARGVPFDFLCSTYWHEMVQAINGAPKGYMSLAYDKARTMGFDRERAKIYSALGKFTNDLNQYEVSIVSDGWENVKGMALINILGVFASGAFFL